MEYQQVLMASGTTSVPESLCAGQSLAPVFSAGRNRERMPLKIHWRHFLDLRRTTSQPGTGNDVSPGNTVGLPSRLNPPHFVCLKATMPQLASALTSFTGRFLSSSDFLSNSSMSLHPLRSPDLQQSHQEINTWAPASYKS